MAAAETNYSFRTAFPDVLKREDDNKVQMEVVRDGAQVVVDVVASASTFTLISPDRNVTNPLIAAQDVVLEGGIPTYNISAAELPDTIPFSQLYQERWRLALPNGDVRTIRRECAVTPFLIYPVAAEEDVTEGEYPNLVGQLAPTLTTLQPFFDEAWKQILEDLFEVGRWPDLMLSTSVFRRLQIEKALYLTFKFLFRATSGSNRWETLMKLHDSQFNARWEKLTSRIDHDSDGLPDDLSREARTTVVHRNAHRTRSMPRRTIY